MKQQTLQKTRLVLRRRRDAVSRIAMAFLGPVAVCMTFSFSNNAQGQTRVDLEDLSVKGELLNDNRLRMSSRESSRIQDRVKFRTNFRSEIIDASDIRVPAAESLSEIEAK